jgi:hypothetical protein
LESPGSGQVVCRSMAPAPPSSDEPAPAAPPEAPGMRRELDRAWMTLWVIRR